MAYTKTDERGNVTHHNPAAQRQQHNAADLASPPIPTPTESKAMTKAEEQEFFQNTLGGMLDYVGIKTKPGFIADILKKDLKALVKPTKMEPNELAWPLTLQDVELDQQAINAIATALSPATGMQWYMQPILIESTFLNLTKLADGIKFRRVTPEKKKAHADRMNSIKKMVSYVACAMEPLERILNDTLLEDTSLSNEERAEIYIERHARIIGFLLSVALSIEVITIPPEDDSQLFGLMTMIVKHAAEQGKAKEQATAYFDKINPVTATPAQSTITKEEEMTQATNATIAQPTAVETAVHAALADAGQVVETVTTKTVQTIQHAAEPVAPAPAPVAPATLTPVDLFANLEGTTTPAGASLFESDAFKKFTDRLSVQQKARDAAINAEVNSLREQQHATRKAQELTNERLSALEKNVYGESANDVIKQIKDRVTNLNPVTGQQTIIYRDSEESLLDEGMRYLGYATAGAVVGIGIAKGIAYLLSDDGV